MEQMLVTKLEDSFPKQALCQKIEEHPMMEWLCWRGVLPKEEDRLEEVHPMIEEEELPKPERDCLSDKIPKPAVRPSSEEHVLPKKMQGHPKTGEHPIQGVPDKLWKEDTNQ